MIKNGMFLFPLTAVLAVLVVFPLSAIELDRSELETILEAEIEFESYIGPVDRVDSRDAIRGIGTFLGGQVSPGVTGDYFGRYRAYRIIGDSADPRRAADILELDAQSRVDHIDNLRRIVAGYLESAWGYRSTDADLLARFITVYNAVHRGDIPFFSTRYRSAVPAALRADSAGLAISYREWPGRTQIVIPIRDDRERGALDVVDPISLIDRAVLADLRSRPDLGVDDRKAIIAFIERVIEERTVAVVREREAIEAERAEIGEQREELGLEPISPPAPPAPPAAPAAADPAPAPPVVAEEAPEETTDPSPDPPATATATAAAPAPAPEAAPVPPELAEREAALAEREEAVRAEEEELEALTEQLAELYQETADDQRALLTADPPGDILPFIMAVRPGTGYELALVDTSRLEIVGVQTIPLRDRTVELSQGRLLVVHGASRRLLLLNPNTLEIEAESERTVLSGSRLRVSGGLILAVVEEGGAAYIGSFDAQLVQTRRSVDSVAAETDIVIQGDRVLVQGPDGALRMLLLRMLE